MSIIFSAEGFRGRGATVAVAWIATSSLLVPGPAHADNSRLNNAIFISIFTAQKRNGCQVSPHWDEQLAEAARLHAVDAVNNGTVNGDFGSDGSTPQSRAQAVGFVGAVSQTIAINPALAINGIDVVNQWWHDGVARETMQDCRNTAVGVSSENSLSRSVLVAVYGRPGM